MTNDFNATPAGDLVNNSGNGPETPVVSLVSDKFNWGAFGFSWIWGLCNKSFITLVSIPVAFIPFIGGLVTLGLSIWFGIKGNTWAWQNKKWESIEQFHNHQKKWAIGYIIIIALSFVLGFIGVIVALTMPALMTNTAHVQNSTAIKKTIVNAQEATMLMEALDEKCTLTSNGLAKCFAKRLNINPENSMGNVLELRDSSIWAFVGDGKCLEKNDCSITVSGKYFTDTLTIPLYAKKGNFIEIRESDVEKYFQ